jgi:hypothetical protein
MAIAIPIASACTTTPKTMDVYFIDVEGGQATLLVSPDGESLLIDAGYPDEGNDARDAKRIVAAAADVADAATLPAFQPRVAILNNGAVKGGDAPMFDLLRAADFDDVWQLHRSENEGAENFEDERIANLDEQTGHWIKMTANRDGSFRIQNGRTGVWVDYGTR